MIQFNKKTFNIIPKILLLLTILLLLVSNLILFSGQLIAKTSNSDAVKKNTASSKTSSLTPQQIKICHHDTSNTTLKETTSIPVKKWTRHEKHGDTKGVCQGILKTYSKSYSSGLKDVKLDSSNQIKFSVTTDSFLIHKGDSISKSIASDSRTFFRVNKQKKLNFISCHDPTEKSDENAILECKEHDSSGEVVNETDFEGQVASHALVGHSLVISQGGKLKLFDLTSDSFVWELEKTHDQFEFNSTYSNFLVTISDVLAKRNILRSFPDAKKISSRESQSFTQNLSDNGDYLYLVKTVPRSRTRSLTVYDKSFEKLASWEKLPFNGNYKGKFYDAASEVFIPLRNGTMLVGNYRKGENKFVDYPINPFSPQAIEIDRENDLLFIYGVNVKGDRAGFLLQNSKRVLLLYDLESDSFLKESLEFSPENYNFDAVTDPVLRKISPNTLAVKHPSNLDIYNYDF